MKKIFMFFLSCVVLLSSTLTVHADSVENKEWYNLVEESNIQMESELDAVPYGLYLMNVQTSLAKLEPDKLGIRADVYCSAVVQKIQIKFTLQKKSGTSWVTVGTGTVYDYNVSSTAKSVAASGVSAGTYRAMASVMVTDKYGYAETMSSFTGSLVVS